MADFSIRSPYSFIRTRREMEALRTNRPDAWDTLGNRLKNYLGRFASGLTSEDIEDLIAGALERTVSLIQTDNISLKNANQQLRRLVERRRKRLKRALEKDGGSVEESSSLLPFVSDPYEKIEARERLTEVRVHAAQMVETIESYMLESLDQLSPKDREILVTSYGYDQHGIPSEGVELSFPSEEAKRKAHFRARQRFSENLERSLTAAIEKIEAEQLHTDLDLQIYRDALDVVQGKRTQQVVEALKRLEEDEEPE